MKRIKSDSFKDFSFVHSLKISPNKKHIVYAVTNADVDDNSYKTNLWAYRFDGKKTFQLTSSNKDSSYIFLESSKVLFSSGKDKPEKKTSYYEVSLDGGESVKAFDIELSVSKLIELYEGKFLVLGSKFAERNEGYHEVNRLPFWLNGQGYNYDVQQALFIYDRVDNKLEKLTDDEFTINDVKFNKDKNILVYSYSTYDCNDFYNNVKVIDLETRKEKKISKDQFIYNFFDFIDEKLIYIGGDMKKHGLNQDSFVYSMNLDGSDDKKIVGKDFDMAFHNSTGTDVRFGGGTQLKVANDKLYFVSTVRDHAYLYSVDLSGKVEEIITNKNSVEMFDIKDNLLVYSAFKDLDLAEIFIKEDLNKKKETKITEFSEVLDEYEISEIEHFTFKNDKNEFDGYVIKPTNYEKGKKYPGLLEIHGGPKTAYSDVLHHEMQLLANEGYFVFYTNPRGSSGRGVEFSDIRGKYGTIDYDDLMKFTDEVLDRYPDIDKDNLGVLGGSYGGFMTNWIIGHTDRFKAANTQRSISNWTSFYGVSDIGYYFATDQGQSSPWDNFELAWNTSPIKYFNKVKTPTLVVHSDQDLRCPLEQGMQVYTALKVHGVDTKMMVFNGETHELSRSGKPKNRIKRLDEIVSWFNKYLKKEENGDSK